MPTDRTEALAAAVHRYVTLLVDGSAADLAGLYADDATLEDPVGGEVHIGRRAIEGFYAAITGLKRQSELVTLRVAGNEAAFQFRLTIDAGGDRMVIEPIDVMVFDADGRITAMKAYWSAADITRL